MNKEGKKANFFGKDICGVGIGGCHQNKEEVFSYAFENRNGPIVLDSGWGYTGTLVNTSFIGEFIKDKNRDDFVIIEKLPLFKKMYVEEFGKSLFEMSVEEMRPAIDKVIQTQLQITGTKYFDAYLLHAIYDDQYSQNPEMEDIEAYKRIVQVLLEYKEKGIIKHIGFSAHVGFLKLYHFCEEINKAFPKALDVAEVSYNILNNKGHTQKEPCYFAKQYKVMVWDAIGEEGIKYLKDNGYFVIDMMPHESGRIGQISTAEDWFRWADRFALNNKNIDVVLEGTSYIPHFQMMLEEAGILKRDVQEMRDIEGTHKHCME